MPETQWMSLTETAEMMKRLPDQVTRMCEDGKLEYYMDGGRYFVSRESIDLFMHPPIVRPAPANPEANPDSNGMPRRQYGRAPHELETSPESASGAQPVNGPDETNASGGSESEYHMEETPGWANEIAEAAVDGEAAVGGEPSKGEESAEGEETAVGAETADVAETAKGEEPAGFARPQDAGYAEEEELQIAGHSEVETEVHPEEQAEAEVDPGEREETAVDPAEHAEAVADPVEPDVRAAELLADLRAALSRHAREHKAFCDEIAVLADALESTLSRDGDKTSELTREISSLLARYTRR